MVWIVEEHADVVPLDEPVSKGRKKGEERPHGHEGAHRPGEREPATEARPPALRSRQRHPRRSATRSRGGSGARSKASGAAAATALCMRTHSTPDGPRAENLACRGPAPGPRCQRREEWEDAPPSSCDAAAKRSSRKSRRSATSERPRVMRSAIIRPMAGDSLKPWPDMPAAT